MLNVMKNEKRPVNGVTTLASPWMRSRDESMKHSVANLPRMKNVSGHSAAVRDRRRSGKTERYRNRPDSRADLFLIRCVR
jgi:hypothetical protein